VRRLRGGLGAYSHALTLEAPDGTRERVVLRRYLVREALTPERAEREFRAIALANKAGIPAPRAIAVDANGEYFGVPTLLLTYLPGRPSYAPSDVAGWTEDLVRAMLAIHAVTPRDYELSWLPSFSRNEVSHELQDDLASESEGAGELAWEVHGLLLSRIDDVAWPEPCLIHEDFWPGNTVWFRGRLTGVIDWINAKLGDPRCDLTQCGIDAVLVQGIQAYDSLRDTYQRMAPSRLPDLWYWELFNGLRALLYFRIWLIGYQDAGLKHVTEPLAQSRIEEFLRRALAEAANPA
jgi:aminoglycoside phosphotransferase (APT) family kinase protein